MFRAAVADLRSASAGSVSLRKPGRPDWRPCRLSKDHTTALRFSPLRPRLGTSGHNRCARAEVVKPPLVTVGADGDVQPIGGIVRRDDQGRQPDRRRGRPAPRPPGRGSMTHRSPRGIHRSPRPALRRRRATPDYRMRSPADVRDRSTIRLPCRCDRYDKPRRTTTSWVP